VSEQEKLRAVMRCYPQGVTVAATTFMNRRWGLTVSSFTSLSLDPPLVLICISKASRAHEAFTASGHFTISVLAEDQREVSELFAGRMGGDADRFSRASALETRRGLPILAGAIAWLECERWALYDGGDHTIIVGRVLDGAVLREAKPLVYYRRRYARLAEGEEALIYAGPELGEW
jgi:flavin reductase (DIM6/NTAB) family NADH-FMN oxidoreductase RutF